MRTAKECFEMSTQSRTSNLPFKIGEIDKLINDACSKGKYHIFLEKNKYREYIPGITEYYEKLGFGVFFSGGAAGEFITIDWFQS